MKPSCGGGLRGPGAASSPSPPSELMRATGLGPSNLPRILDLVSKVCRSNGYRLVRVYARRKSRGYWVEGVEVLPHS
ncbi:MAG: hypothetical protein QXJ59_11145, partial [Thermofilaceae archaeon]